jgi:hypothetical protein
MTLRRGEPRHLVGAGLVDAVGEVFELRWDLDPGRADASTLDVHCGPDGEFTRIGIDHRHGVVWIDGGREQAWAGARGPLLLSVVVNRGSVEVSSGDGHVALSTQVTLTGQGVAVLKQGRGDWVRSVLTVWPLA